MWDRKVAFYLQVLVQVVGVPLLVGPPVAVYDAVVGIPNLRLNEDDQGKMLKKNVCHFVKASPGGRGGVAHAPQEEDPGPSCGLPCWSMGQ